MMLEKKAKNEIGHGQKTSKSILSLRVYAPLTRQRRQNFLLDNTI